MSYKEEKYNKRRLASSYLTTIVSISLVLFMLGLLGIVILHAKKLSEHIKENISFSIIINEDVKEAGIKQLQKLLDASVFVKSTEYITKEEAAKDLSEQLGEDFIDFLGYNPLLPSIDLRLKAEYANPDSLVKIENQLVSNKIVKEIFYQKSLVYLINDNLKKISFLILGFAILLMIISIALINNTIRLSVYSKRFIIKSMQLVGATQGFIRRPFVFRGIINGVYGAFTAIVLLTGILYLSQKEVPELMEIQDINLLISLFAIVIILGIIITWLSTFFAVRKYLRIKNDNLYY